MTLKTRKTAHTPKVSVINGKTFEPIHKGVKITYPCGTVRKVLNSWYDDDLDLLAEHHTYLSIQSQRQ